MYWPFPKFKRRNPSETALAVSGEAIPDFSKDNKQNLQNNNKSKKTGIRQELKLAKSRSKASTENLFAEIDAMTTSLRSPPKSTINAKSLVDNNGTNKDYCKDDEFAFEFQEISDKVNLVVSQIENLEIESLRRRLQQSCCIYCEERLHIFVR